MKTVRLAKCSPWPEERALEFYFLLSVQGLKSWNAALPQFSSHKCTSRISLNICVYRARVCHLKTWSVLNLHSWGWRDGSSLRASGALAEDPPSSVPSTHTWQLTTACNSGFRGSDALLLASVGTHTLVACIHKDRQHIKWKSMCLMQTVISRGFLFWIIRDN